MVEGTGDPAATLRLSRCLTDNVCRCPDSAEQAAQLFPKQEVECVPLLRTGDRLRSYFQKRRYNVLLFAEQMAECAVLSRRQTPQQFPKQEADCAAILRRGGRLCSYSQTKAENVALLRIG